MRTKASDTFLKHLDALPDAVRARVERFAFDELPTVPSLHGLANLKKLKGYKNYYRIRFGEYRVGVELKDDGVVLLKVVLHRRNIYRRFP